MFSNFEIIHPDFRKVIYSAKTENNHPTLLKPFCRNFKLALIPRLTIMIAKALIGLPGRGNSDLCTVISVLYFREGKIPLTIEGDASARGQEKTSSAKNERLASLVLPCDPGSVSRELF